MPSPVDKYFKQVKKENPSYDDEQAWATAWSIYCKHKNPGSDHCKKPTSEYLKGKSAMNPLRQFQDAVLVRNVVAGFQAAIKPKSVADKHQLKILIDTVKNPSKGFLGGPDAEESEDILRSKFKYTDAEIAKLKG